MNSNAWKTFLDTTDWMSDSVVIGVPCYVRSTKTGQPRPVRAWLGLNVMTVERRVIRSRSLRR